MFMDAAVGLFEGADGIADELPLAAEVKPAL
jgi:hypothetical protein